MCSKIIIDKKKLIYCDLKEKHHKKNFTTYQQFISAIQDT